VLRSSMCVRSPKKRPNFLENAVKPKFVERQHDEDKRCMLVFLKPGTDFSRGCADGAISHPILKTHSPTDSRIDPSDAGGSKSERGKSQPR
jgi:hypothetical protein